MTDLAAANASPAKGIGCMVGGCVLLTLSDAVTKLLSEGYPVGQVILMRSLFVFLPIAGIVWMTGGLAVLRVRNPGGQAAHAAFSIISTFLFLIGLSYLPLADAVAITFAGPLFITALAPVLLRERVGWRRWVAVLGGFLGVLVMVRPSGDALRWVALLPLFAACGGAMRDLVARRIRNTQSAISTLFFTSLALTLSALGFLPFGWKEMIWGDVGLIALAGILVGLSQYLTIEAFRSGEAAIIAPFKYTTMIWAVLFGFLIWGDVPKAWVLVGVVLVGGSGLYILNREARLGLRPSAGQPPR